MYPVFLILHVIACFVLIFVVLLQAGRGGGFSDMMGGGQPQSLFGTQTNAFMLKATEVCAVIFIITSLALGMLSSQKNKSLVAKNALMRDIQAKMPLSMPSKAPAATPAPAQTPAPSAPAKPPVPAEANAS